MSDVLILQLPNATRLDAELIWTVVRDNAVIAEGQLEAGGEADWPDAAQADRAIVLLPSEDLFLRRAPVPGQSERDARRAAPFLIEDHLAQTLDDVSVEIGPAGSDGSRWIMAVDRSLREHWRARLSGLNLPAVHVLPDAMALKTHGGDLTVMDYGDRILFQTRAADRGVEDETGQDLRDLEASLSDPICGAIEPALLNPVLAGLGHRLHPRRILVTAELSPSPLAVADTPLAVKRMEAPDLRLAAAAMDVDDLARLPAILGTAFGPALDLVGLARPWRWAAGLAVASLLGVTALSAGQAIYLEQRSQQYEDARRAAFTERFPETRVNNVRVQMNQALRGLQGGADQGAGFLPLASALADILDSQDQVRVDAIRYDASRGELSVTALYTGFGDFEALRIAAEARGVVLEDGGARQNAQGVAAEFTVRLP